MARKLKVQITGRVTEVGWEEKSWRNETHENYAMVRVRVSRSKNQDTAEMRMNRLRKKLLNKTVTMFPQ